SGQWREPDKPFCILHRLCVDPQYQNQGVAGRTMAHIERMAFRQGERAIRLDAFSENLYSLKLYRRCGYTKVGTAEWRKGTFYLMEKYLP
ncbi:MAG: GNAT family N-acetyltransferase, partial [Lachnospiraceae bacterium]|nr:GNAT family N-acetyltransferase [Lachnospiraceae bacterium]